MSRIPSLFGSWLGRAGLATVFCTAAIGMSGCISSGTSGGNHHVAFWGITTDHIMIRWAGPTCDQDVTGDGTRGSPKDRALCAFFIIRGICNGAAEGNEHGVCYVATEPEGNPYGDDPTFWQSFDEAARRRNTANSCLDITYGALGDVRDWTVLPRGGGGGACEH